MALPVVNSGISKRVLKNYADPRVPFKMINALTTDGSKHS